MCACLSSPSLIELEIPYNQLQGSLLNVTLIAKEPSGCSGARVSFYAERTLRTGTSIIASFLFFPHNPFHCASHAPRNKLRPPLQQISRQVLAKKIQASLGKGHIAASRCTAPLSSCLPRSRSRGKNHLGCKSQGAPTFTVFSVSDKWWGRD